MAALKQAWVVVFSQGTATSMERAQEQGSAMRCQLMNRVQGAAGLKSMQQVPGQAQTGVLAKKIRTFQGGTTGQMGSWQMSRRRGVGATGHNLPPQQHQQKP
jgi:hypothetical protein